MTRDRKPYVCPVLLGIVLLAALLILAACGTALIVTVPEPSERRWT